MSTLVSMMVGSRLASLPLVRDSILTILANIGDDVTIAIAVSSYLPKTLVGMIQGISKSHPGKIVLFPGYEGSYARFANIAISACHDYKWVIFSHDDIRLQSPNLIPQVELALRDKKDPIGWISFLDTDYLTPTSWAPSIREGFHIDAVQEAAWSRRKIHKFHRLPEDWWGRYTAEELALMPFDIPDQPVRCHGPFSHFIMIDSETLRKAIRRCEDWCPVSLLIDEDWGLTAMREGLYNIWMPQLKYIHVRPPTGTRANGLIQQYGAHVHAQFVRKWGFPHKAIYSSYELKVIKRRFPRSNILWSQDRRSYEWDPVQ